MTEDMRTAVRMFISEDTLIARQQGVKFNIITFVEQTNIEQ